MSSHRRRVKHFGRKFKARKALFRGLVSSLVEHGRITTTVDKAKELRRYVEKAITLGKKGDLATRRLLLARYPNNGVVSTIIDDLAVRFKVRPGGYTRIIKIGPRPGDMAEMAFVEFVDYKFDGGDGTAAGLAKKTNIKAREGDDIAKVEKKKSALKVRILADKKKAISKKQKRDRAASRD